MKQIKGKIPNCVRARLRIGEETQVRLVRECRDAPNAEVFPGAIGRGVHAAYEGRVYTSKVDNNSRDRYGRATCNVQRTRAHTRARTCAISVASSRHLRARGIFPRDERTISMAKRKTRAALGGKYMERSAGMRFREERRRGRARASKQESYE